VPLLINADWVGADLTGATLTGAKLYLVPRFGIVADEISCEWIDLSPSGDRTQIQHFNSPSESKKFLNQQPGLVQIAVDALLNHEANRFLAAAYYQISQQYPPMSSPPNIEIGYRRTTLTFRFESDVHLLPAAFLAILPFSEAVQTQKNIVAIGKTIQVQDLEKKRIVQLCTALNAAINNLTEVKKALPAPNPGPEMKFFQSPNQTVLISSRQQSLTVQSHPNFGKRGGNSKQNKFSLPGDKKIVDFLASFDYVD
jgi:hypothetical protein